MTCEKQCSLGKFLCLCGFDVLLAFLWYFMTSFIIIWIYVFLLFCLSESEVSLLFIIIESEVSFFCVLSPLMVSVQYFDQNL